MAANTAEISLDMSESEPESETEEGAAAEEPGLVERAVPAAVFGETLGAKERFAAKRTEPQE